MAFSSGGIDQVEHATAASNAALYAAARIRARLGYLISPEDATDLDTIEEALIRIQDIYLPKARAALSAAHVERSGR